MALSRSVTLARSLALVLDVSRAAASLAELLSPELSDLLTDLLLQARV